MAKKKLNENVPKREHLPSYTLLYVSIKKKVKVITKVVTLICGLIANIKPTVSRSHACTDMSLFRYFSLFLLVLCTRIEQNRLFILMVSTASLAFITVVSGRLYMDFAVSDFT